MVIKLPPNVYEVCFSQKIDAVGRDWLSQGWPYFSAALINMNCWKLQLLPTLGEYDIISALYYYTYAYYSRNTLKKLELSFNMLSSQDFRSLKEFTALETLEIHKDLISGFNDLELIIQFTPNIQELTIRFATNRVCQHIKKGHVTYSSLKKLCLHDFTKITKN